MYMYLFIPSEHLVRPIAARIRPSPLLCGNLNQAAKTDASMAALIAPEQDVHLVQLQSALAKLQRCVDVVSQLVKRGLEFLVAYDSLQVEWEVSQMMVCVGIPGDLCRAREPLSFPLALPFVAFLLCCSVRVEETVPGVHHEKMLVGA